MAQAVSRRPFAAEARVHSRVNPCGICSGQSGGKIGFCRRFSIFPVNIIPPLQSQYMLSLLLFVVDNKNKF
jgi:hypothetical protein